MQVSTELFPVAVSILHRQYLHGHRYQTPRHSARSVARATFVVCSAAAADDVDESLDEAAGLAGFSVEFSAEFPLQGAGAAEGPVESPDEVAGSGAGAGEVAGPGEDTDQVVRQRSDALRSEAVRVIEGMGESVGVIEGVGEVAVEFPVEVPCACAGEVVIERARKCVSARGERSTCHRAPLGVGDVIRGPEPLSMLQLYRAP